MFEKSTADMAILGLNFKENFFPDQNKFDPVTTDNILSEVGEEKWYHGERKWQKEKGSKWYKLKRQPMETEPKK